MTLELKVSNCIAALCQELASELDLHYEDGDLPATSATINVLREAGALLLENGTALPEAQQHILKRYAEATGGVQ